jgi:hypothetical protein
MTAGSIAVPTIMPLRAPVVGKLKNLIDTCTPIELRTGFFMINYSYSKTIIKY